MLTLNAIRTNQDEIVKRLSLRGKDRSQDIKDILSFDESKRQA